MALIGNYSVIHKSPGRFMSGTSVSSDKARDNKSGSNRNRFMHLDRKNATPNGYTPPYSFVIAQNAGGLASYKSLAAVVAISNSLLAAGISLDAALSASVSLTQAQLDQIVGLVAAISASITTTDAQLAAVASLVASISASMSITGNQLGAIVELIATLSASMTGSANDFATASMSASISSLTVLSPGSLAASLWNSLATDYNSVGSMGEKLNAAGGGSNPADIAQAVWEATVPGSYISGSAGYQLGNTNGGVSGSSSINTVADGFVLTTGVETGSYSNTVSNNNLDHVLDGVGNLIDGYYTFNVGLGGVPVSATAYANLQSGNDSLDVFGYRWTDSSWVQIGVLPGTGSGTKATYTFPFLSNLVGSGINAGKVRLRFSGGSSNPRLDMGFLLLSYSVIPTNYSLNGILDGATSNTASLPSGASSLDDYYKPGLLVIIGGTGSGQSRRVDGYIGSSRTLTLATNWVTTPDNTSNFQLIPWGSVRVSDMDNSVLSDIASAGWNQVIESGYTAEEILRILLAVAAGKTTISGSTVTFRDQADTKARVTASMTGSQRTSTSLDGN